MKEGQIYPRSGNTTLKKPSLIRVKVAILHILRKL